MSVYGENANRTDGGQPEAMHVTLTRTAVLSMENNIRSQVAAVSPLLC